MKTSIDVSKCYRIATVCLFGDSKYVEIMKTRIHAACELLGSTREAMSEIARQCGFADQSSFTQHFRRHTGTTPRHWQRLYGRKS